MAMANYGNVRSMAATWSRVVRTKANNERAASGDPLLQNVVVEE